MAGYDAIQGSLAVAVPRHAKPSFIAVGFMVMLGDAVRGVFFPTLWPLVSSFGGTRASQGVVVAAFSMGRVLVSPSYGAYSTKYGYRRVLTFAHGLIVVGALLYTRVWSIASLVCAQLILGLGCGTLGVTRAYFAESVPRDQRTVWLGRVTAAQYCGLTCTSFFGSLLARTGATLEHDASLAFLRISPLTFAAYAVFMGAVVALLLLWSPRFYDFVPADRAATVMEAREEGPEDDDRTHFRLVVVGLVLNIITKGAIGCYETLGVSYAQANLHLDGPTVGYYVAACGLGGVVLLLSFKRLGRLFDDVELILYGIGVMVLSCLLMVRRLSQDIVGDDDRDVDAFAAWLTAMVCMYGVGPTRCLKFTRQRHRKCIHAGYPVGHTAVIGWFSKAIKQRPQGLLMGLFASAGSVARIVFPVCSGMAADAWGPDVVFATLAGLLGAMLFVLTWWRRAFRAAII